jgi:hypothetical protein
MSASLRRLVGAGSGFFDAAPAPRCKAGVVRERVRRPQEGPQNEAPPLRPPAANPPNVDRVDAEALPQASSSRRAILEALVL